MNEKRRVIDSFKRTKTSTKGDVSKVTSSDSSGKSCDDGTRARKPKAISSFILGKAGGIVVGSVKSKGAIHSFMRYDQAAELFSFHLIDEIHLRWTRSSSIEDRVL